MQKKFAFFAVALIAASAVGCSSPPHGTPSGTLATGTAQVTINGGPAYDTHAVDCTSIETLTIIRSGDESAGFKTLVSSKHTLVAESVDINDLGGFTGSYMKGLDGHADVEMKGNTYTIRGSAEGFNADQPAARTTDTFAIQVAC